MIQLTLMISRSITKVLIAPLLLLIFSLEAMSQEAIAPPSLGQQTQGEPAVANPAELNTDSTNGSDTALTGTNTPQDTEKAGLLGKTEISELRRENGQVYRIELEHSSGSKQYIDEFDSDGRIESTDNDIEETPNLAKWRLGSW